MPEQRGAWDEAMEFLNDYGTNWPTEMERRMAPLRAADGNADEKAHLNRIIECLVRFHFPGRSN